MNKLFWIGIFVLIILSALILSKTNRNSIKGPDVYIITALILVLVIVIAIMGSRIQEKYLEDDPILVKIKDKMRICFPEIDNTILLKGKKSYTINKKRIHLCLKDEKGDYYDENMLIYVTIHELAHVKCPEVGHTDKFYDIFNELLDKASACGIYDKHKPLIKDYCEYAKDD